MPAAAPPPTACASHLEVATQTEGRAGVRGPNSESTATQVAGKPTQGHSAPRFRDVKTAIRLALKHGAHGVNVETGGTRIEFYGLCKKNKPGRTERRHDASTTAHTSTSQPGVEATHSSRLKRDSKKEITDAHACQAADRTTTRSQAHANMRKHSPRGRKTATPTPSRDLATTSTTPISMPANPSTPDREEMVKAACNVSTPQAREALDVVHGNVSDAIDSFRVADKAQKPPIASPEVDIKSTSMKKTTRMSTRGAQDVSSPVQPLPGRSPAGHARAPGPSPSPPKPTDVLQPAASSKKGKSTGKDNRSGRG